MLELKERLSVKEIKKSTKIEGKMFSEEVSDTSRILGFGERLEEGDYFQQGDCILVQIGDQNFENSPTQIKGSIQKSNVVLKGNTNSHALYGGDFKIYKDGDQIYIDVKSFTVLDHVKDTVNNEHAEHHAQYIPQGKYYVKGLMEFDHLEKMARKVID